MVHKCQIILWLKIIALIAFGCDLFGKLKVI